MNEILATILGVILYIAMMWILLAVMRLEKTRPEDDDAALDTIRDELDRQEGKTRKVRAVS